MYMQIVKSLPGFWFLFFLIICFPDASGAWPSLNYTHTSGSNSYDGNTLDAVLDLPSGFYVGGSFNAYSSDNSSGTIKTYYGRLGRYTENGSWKLFGSVTPEVGRYKAVGGGGEFRVALINGDETKTEEKGNEPPPPQGEQVSPNTVYPPRWHSNPQLDLIGGYRRMMFTDQGQNINENDFTGGLGFNLYKTYLSGTYIKSVYDEEFSGMLNPFSHRFAFGYASSFLSGYPSDAFIVSMIGSWRNVERRIPRFERA